MNSISNYKLKIKFFCILFILSAGAINSQNSISKYLGVSDPHIRVFNDTVYLYSGHDAHPDDKLWVMKDWQIFSSTDLFNWDLKGIISPKDNYMGANSIDCWAGDAATRNGNYYFYFSDQKRGVGVMTSKSPTGPFKDALGKPLVAPLHDPTVFIDDDLAKTPYIVYGDKSDSYYVARLNEDMISTHETPKPIKIIGKSWDNAPKWMDKNYLFKYKDTYYLSWGAEYATSKNIYGPYQSAGSFGNGHNLNELAHGSFFWWKNQFYHVWCYYIRPGFKYRALNLTYCHIDDAGEIVSDTNFLDLHANYGVGHFESSWPKIEAEWFSDLNGSVNKGGTRKDGFYLRNIKNNNWVKFARVDFDGQQNLFEAAISNFKGKGTIEIRTQSPTGKMIGSLSLCEKTNNSNNQLLFTKIKKISGTNDLYLCFKGDKAFDLTLDYFIFKK